MSETAEYVTVPGIIAVPREGAESMPEAHRVDPVYAARQVVETGTAHVVDGVLLDLFTASAVVQVADALSPANAQRLAGMSVPAAVAVVWKVIERSKP